MKRQDSPRTARRCTVDNRALADDTLPDPLVHPLNDNRRLVELVSQVLDKPQEWVRQALLQEELYLGQGQRDEFRRSALTPHVWSTQSSAYYRETIAVPAGLPVWNRRPEKLAIRQWIGERLHHTRTGPLDVLTIGDGGGFDSLYLSQCGHRVTFSEVSPYSMAMARRVFSINGASVDIVDDMTNIAEATYDVVVCLDVLEHLENPPDAVASFSRYLRDDGYLVVHAPFFFISDTNPTHLAANVKYSGDLRNLYGKQGFRLHDGRLLWNPLILVKGAPEAALPGAGFARRSLIRTIGMLLAFARVWRKPHVALATRMVQKADGQWLEGLAPSASASIGIEKI